MVETFTPEQVARLNAQISIACVIATDVTFQSLMMNILYGLNPLNIAYVVNMLMTINPKFDRSELTGFIRTLAIRTSERSIHLLRTNTNHTNRFLGVEGMELYGLAKDASRFCFILGSFQFRMWQARRDRFQAHVRAGTAGDNILCCITRKGRYLQRQVRHRNTSKATAW